MSKIQEYVEMHRKLAETLERIGWLSEASRVRNEAEGAKLLYEGGIIDAELEEGPHARDRANSAVVR